MKKVILAYIFFLIIAMYPNVVQACIGARAAGMGHTGVAGQTDATVVYWNPAMLPWTNSGISFGVVRPLKYDYLAISGRNIGFLYVDEEWDPYTHVSIGLEVTPNFAVGCSLGLAYSYLDAKWLPYMSPAVAWKTGNVTIGVLLQAMVNLRPAISYRYKNLVLSAEYYDILDYYLSRRLRLGVEYNFKSLFLRCGTEFTKVETIKNIGLGVKLNNMFFDISYDTQSKWTVSTTYTF